MNIPNFISILRLCTVPVIIWLIFSGDMKNAFWLTLVAALSDAIDGIIAKTCNMITVLGGYLDPIADKALLVFLYIALGHEGYLPIWLVVLVVFRDLVIIGGALSFHVMTQSLEMSPLLVSKINTFAQLILAVVILGSEGLQIDDSTFRGLLINLVGFTTAISGMVYIIVWCQKATKIEIEDL